MTTCAEIVEHLRAIAPVATGVSRDLQTGWLFGDAAQTVAGVGVCWSPTRALLEEAAGAGLNFVIAHEPLFFPFVDTAWWRDQPADLKPANVARRAILQEHRIAVCGYHSPWDVKPGDGVVDQCAAALGLPAPSAAGYAQRLYEVEPVGVLELAARVGHRLGVPGVRVVGEVEMTVTRVGLSVGGLGQRFGAPEEFAEWGAEVVVFGEMLEYTWRHGLELGLTMIEAGHCATETPGMRRMAEVLQEAFPHLPVRFLDAGKPYRFV